MWDAIRPEARGLKRRSLFRNAPLGAGPFYGGESIVIFGTGPAALAVAQRARTVPGIRLVGFVDDRPAQTLRRAGALPLWSLDDLPGLLRQVALDSVVMADPSLPGRAQTELSWRLDALGLTCERHALFMRRTGAGGPVQPRFAHEFDYLLPQRVPGPDLPGAGGVYRNRTVLVTGAGGTIGGEICRQLLDLRPRRIVMIDLSEFGLYQSHQMLGPVARRHGIAVAAELGSVTDSVFVSALIDRHKPDVILHAAAYKHVALVEGNARAGLHNNTIGTAVIAQKAREKGVPRFVLVSTDKAVRPGGVMGASKRLAELVVQDLASRPDSTRFSIVRFGNVAGSSGSVLPLFRDQIAAGGPVTLSHPLATRYFMTLAEAGRLVLAAGSLGSGGEIFALDMGKPLLIRDLAVRMIEAGARSPRDADNPDGDIEIVTTGLRAGEKLHEDRMVGEDPVPTEHPHIFVLAEGGLSEIEIAGVLRDLREALEQGDDGPFRAAIKRWIEVDRKSAASARRDRIRPISGVPA